MKRDKWCCLPVCLFALLLWLAAGAAYAGITGKIAGQIYDQQTGEPLIGVNVMIEGTSRGAATDLNGEYFIINIPPGSYTLKVQMMGYRSSTTTDVRVKVDYTTTMNIELASTVLEMDEVVVTAQRDVIQHDLTASATTVNSDLIEDIPVNTINEVLDLQAGMVRDSGGQLHIRGGRSSEVAYMLDGVQINDPVYRSSSFIVDNQAVEEVQALLGTFNAEYGQALSGIVNIVTKRGSDKFKINVLGQFGDYYSESSVYSVVDDPEWMQSAFMALTNDSRMMFYDGMLLTEQSGQRPEIKKKNYLNSYNPITDKDFQVNISGPVPGTKNNLTYFISGRFVDSQGYQMGVRYFMPWGVSRPLMDLDQSHTYDLPDQKMVPFGKNKSYSLQSKLYWRLSNTLNMSYGLYWQDQNNRGSSYQYKYVPDGIKQYFNNSMTHLVTLNHMLSKNTFYEVRFSNYKKIHENYLYEDPYDYHYMSPLTSDFEQYVLGSRFLEGVSLAAIPSDLTFWGNQNDRFRSDVSYNIIKADLTSQVTNRHQVKAGFEATLYDVQDEYINLQFDNNTYQPLIVPLGSAFHNQYQHKPSLFSAYLQDKAEFKEIIFNLGIRFDYFRPDGNTLADPTDPQIYNPFNPANVYAGYYPGIPQDSIAVLLTPYTVAERESFWYEEASPKYQLSPRFGIAFPISDQGNIHFAYGHFFQVPSFQYLYTNPEFEIAGAGAQNLIGNANLNPERTVSYELGLQQAIGNNFNFTLTGFYRDIRDWITTSPMIQTYGRGITYVKYINKDFGNAQGIELAANYNSDLFTFNVDYSIMVAEGTNSDPRDAFYAIQDNEEPQIALIPMNWDRTHSMNVILIYHDKGWTATTIGQIYSGFPYTPTFRRGEATGGSLFRGLRANSARQPTTFNLDIKFSKSFIWSGWRFEAYFNAFNLLDTRNANGVYSDTGSPEYTLQGVTQKNRVVSVVHVDEFYNNPGMFKPPRFIQLGFKVSY